MPIEPTAATALDILSPAQQLPVWGAGRVHAGARPAGTPGRLRTPEVVTTNLVGARENRGPATSAAY